MSKKIIKTDKAPLPIGPYNQAVMIGSGTSGKIIFTAGQIAIDPKTNQVCPGGISEQTRMVLENIKGVLAGAGASLQNVIKSTVYLQNMTDFHGMNMVYSEFFDPLTAPARSTVEVARLPKNVLIEIEVVAFV